MAATFQSQLKGAQRDAAASMITLFEQYGLGSLAPKIVEYVQQGYGSDTMLTLLQETTEYKRRFAANEARRKAGLSVLSPAEYLATERAYAQALQAAGLPAGFYDDPAKDFQRYLERDISPTEIKERADSATAYVNTLDPLALRALQREKGLSVGDLAAYFLDEKTALPLLQKQVETTLLGAERERAGFSYNQASADRLFSTGISVEQARQGFGAIAEMEPTFSKLGEIDDTEFGVDDLEAEVFGSSGEAAGKRKKLASAERGRFGSSAGAGQETLRRDDAFSY